MNRTIKSALLMITTIICGCSSDSQVTLESSVHGGASNPSAPHVADATSLGIKVYKFAVSESAKCSDPITVFAQTNPARIDMATEESFGSGALVAGSYPCVMLEVGKILRTAVGTSEIRDSICANTQESELIDGTSVTCSHGNDSDQRITLFFTTLSAGNSGVRSLLPPLSNQDTTSGMKLSSALEITGGETVKLTVNLHNLLQCGSDELTCNLPNPPLFSIK